MTKFPLPDRWREAKLGDFFRIKHGYAFKGAHFVSEGSQVVLTPGNFKQDGGLKSQGAKEKFYSTAPPLDFVLKRGDLLVVMTDLTQEARILGSPAFIPEDGRYLHNQRLGKVVELNNEKLDQRYLYYMFNSSLVREQLKSTATGATVKHTAPDRIYAVEFSLPPLPTQCRIASILSAYDDMIENNTRRIAILEEMARRLYEEWFVHYRFPGHEGVKMVESEIGEVPEGWSVSRLADLAEIIMGQSPRSEFYNEVGEGLPFHQGVTNFGEFFPTDRLYCTIENRIAETDDILFSVRAPVGRINIATKKMVIGRGLSAIRSKTGHQTFLLCQLRSKFSDEDMIGGGTIFKSVTKKDMHDVELIDPQIEIIERFEQHVVPCWGLIRALTDKNTNLCAQRDFLLPKLISGEIDVSEVGEPAVEAAE